MTYKERLEKDYPDNVSKTYWGGCKGCPDRYGYCKSSNTVCRDGIRFPSIKSCKECWNREIPGTEGKKTDRFDLRYIHDLIEDAMAKKDRYVTIYFGEHGPHVSVYPLTEEEE